MRQIVVERHLSTVDLGAVQRLLAVAGDADGRQPLSDHLLLDLVNGGGSGFTGLLARPDDRPGQPSPNDASGGDGLMAYAQISRGNEEHLLEVVIDPAWRDDQQTVDAEMVDAAIDVIASQGGGPVTWWVSEPEAGHRRIAARADLGEGRILLQMRRPLPTGLAVTVETRAFRPGIDDEEWLAVNNRAFADHGEQGGWDLDTLHRRQAEEWFDPDGFRVHERDGRLAAFCWTKVHPPEGDNRALGEIYVIAVDPDFHGLGLGKQLTLAGLQSLSDRGITMGMLYVDDDNVAARTLYERLGFEVSSRKAAFVGDVSASTPPPATRIHPTRSDQENDS